MGTVTIPKDQYESLFRNAKNWQEHLSGMADERIGHEGVQSVVTALTRQREHMQGVLAELQAECAELELRRDSATKRIVAAIVRGLLCEYDIELSEVGEVANESL